MATAHTCDDASVLEHAHPRRVSHGARWEPRSRRLDGTSASCGRRGFHAASVAADTRHGKTPKSPVVPPTVDDSLVASYTSLLPRCQPVFWRAECARNSPCPARPAPRARTEPSVRVAGPRGPTRDGPEAETPRRSTQRQGRPSLPPPSSPPTRRHVYLQRAFDVLDRLIGLLTGCSHMCINHSKEAFTHGPR